jgi:hypothetical protein
MFHQNNTVISEVNRQSDALIQSMPEDDRKKLLILRSMAWAAMEEIALDQRRWFLVVAQIQ